MRRALALTLAVLAPACGGSSAASSYGFRTLEDRAVSPPRAAVAAREASPNDATPPPPLDRKRRPLTPPTERRLSNGVRVLLLERHDFPTIAASFILDRGSADAPPGVAALYAEGLRGASRGFPAKEAFEFLHYVGARTSTWSGRDGLGIQVLALSPLFDGALARVASMFTSPLFESEELDLARQEAANRATEEEESPDHVASATVRGLVLGETHPYTRSAHAVDSARFMKMSKNELESFRDMFVAPDRITVAVVGDFSAPRIVARLEQGVSKLRRRSTPPSSASQLANTNANANPNASPNAKKKAKIVVVPRKDASQANVALGFVGAARGSEDRAALSILQALLGRGLSGRLDLKVRGEHGYSYGVHMMDRAWRSAGVIEISTAVESSHAAEAVKGLVDELARTATQPIDPDELARAKTHALASLLDDDMSSSASELDMLETLAVENLPLDWYERVASRIEALTEPEIRAAAGRFLTTESVQIAVVGDPGVVASPLRALAIGDVDVRAQR